MRSVPTKNKVSSYYYIFRIVYMKPNPPESSLLSNQSVCLSNPYFKVYCVNLVLFLFIFLVPGCGGNLTAVSGTFSSPLYPNLPSNTSFECVWNIEVWRHLLNTYLLIFCDSWRHLIRASWQAPARRTIRITWRELSFSRGNGTCDNNGLTITDVTDDGQRHQVQFCGLVRTTTPFLCSEFYFTLLFIRVSQVDRSSAPQLDLGRRARVVMKSDGQLSGRGFLLAFTAA